MIWYEYLLYLLLMIISCFVFLKCFSKVHSIKMETNYKKLVIIFISCILMFINNYHNIFDFRFLLSFFITTLMFIMYFKTDIKETIIYSFIFYLIASLLEFLLVICLTKIVYVSLNVINQPWIKFSLSTIHLLIMYLVFSLKRFQLSFLNATKYIAKKINHYYVVASIIIVINVLYIFLGININTPRLIMVLIVVSVFILLLFIYLNETSKKNDYYLEMKYLTEIIDEYEKVIKEYRILKHNLINDLLSIRTNLNVKMIDEKIKKYSKDYEWLSVIGKIPNGIQGMIFLKSEQALKKKVKYIISSENIKMDSIRIKSKFLSKINEVLGIYLDNATEAASHLVNKVVFVNLSTTKNHLYVKIINEINGKVNIDMIGKESYSTKKKKSGLGLSYAKHISKSKIKTTVSINNNYYCVDLKIIILKK